MIPMNSTSTNIEKNLKPLIVAFGDSLTYGYGIKEEKDKWTFIIAEELGCKIINSGVCGNTSGEGLSRINEAVLKHKPDYVLINFGMNDHFMKSYNEPKATLGEFQNNIETIISLVKEIGAEPILITPNGFIEGNPGDGNMGGGATYYYRRHPAKRYEEVGGATKQLEAYCNKIKEIGKREDVSVIDINEASREEDLYSILISKKNSEEEDGVHINELGARFYADMIIAYFKSCKKSMLIKPSI